jgi:hypothetical protein
VKSIRTAGATCRSRSTALNGIASVARRTATGRTASRSSSGTGARRKREAAPRSEAAGIDVGSLLQLRLQNDAGTGKGSGCDEQKGFLHGWWEWKTRYIYRDVGERLVLNIARQGQCCAVS